MNPQRKSLCMFSYSLIHFPSSSPQNLQSQLFLNNSITCVHNLETYHRTGNSGEDQRFRHLKGAVKSSSWCKIIITLKNYLQSLLEMIDWKKKKRTQHKIPTQSRYLPTIKLCYLPLLGLNQIKNPIKGLFRHTTVTSFTSQPQAQVTRTSKILPTLKQRVFDVVHLVSLAYCGCELQNGNILTLSGFRRRGRVFFCFVLLLICY